MSNVKRILNTLPAYNFPQKVLLREGKNHICTYFLSYCTLLIWFEVEHVSYFHFEFAPITLLGTLSFILLSHRKISLTQITQWYTWLHPFNQEAC